MLNVTRVRTSYHHSAKSPFPLAKFYNMSIRHRFYIDLVSTSLCEQRDASINGCCQCDQHCAKTRNCCADVLWKQAVDPHQRYTNMSMYIAELLKTVAKHKYVECREPFPRYLSPLHFVEKYYIRGECDHGSSAEDRELCENEHSGLLPSSMVVFGNDGYLYKNIYCAKCNSVKEFKLNPIRMNCLHKSDQSDCKYTLVHSKSDAFGDFEACFNTELKSNCPPGSKYYDICRAFRAPVAFYRNYFCALCAEMKIKWIGSCQYTSGMYYPFSTKYKLQFKSRSTATPVSQYVLPPCKKHILSDLLEMKCYMPCPQGYEVALNANSKCVKIEFSTVFDKCLIRDQNSRLFMVNITNYDPILSLLYNITNNTRLQIVGNETNSSITELNTKIDGSTVEELLQLSRNITMLLGKYGKILITIDSIDVNVLKHLNFTHIFPIKKLCLEPVIMKEEEVDLYSSCNAMYKGEAVRHENLTLWLEISNATILRRLSVCRRYFQRQQECIGSDNTINTSNGGMKNSSTHTDGNNGTIDLFDSYITYIKTGSECIDVRKEQPGDWIQTISAIEWHLSLFGSLVSVICFLIIAYLHTKVEHLTGNVNSPSKLIFSVFLLENTLFLTRTILSGVGSISPAICMLFGVLMHFTMLYLHSWGVVISANVSQIISAQLDTKRGFYKSSLICFSITFGTVLLEILLDMSNALDANYGGIGACAQDFFYSPIIFYYLPIVGELITSTLFLGMHYFKAKNSSRQHEKFGRNREEGELNTLHIALKLIYVCGVGETLCMFTLNRSGVSENGFCVQCFFIVIQTVLISSKGVILMISIRHKVMNVIRGTRQRSKSQIQIDPRMYDDGL